MRREQIGLILLSLLGWAIAVGPTATEASVLALAIVGVYGATLHLVRQGLAARQPGPLASATAATLLALPVLASLVGLWAEAVAQPFGWSLAFWSAVAATGIVWALAARRREHRSPAPHHLLAVLTR